MKKSENQSRRHFIESAALIGALGTLGFGQLLQSCKNGSTPEETGAQPMPDRAPDGKPLRAGVIGCGGRGSGAAANFLRAGSGLTITALADVFQPGRRVRHLAEEVAGKDMGVDIDQHRALPDVFGCRTLAIFP